VIRGSSLILQIHLPYPLLKGEKIPSWWEDEDGLFARVLSDTAIKFFGEGRTSDLRATHTSTENGGPLPLDSWYLEARNESIWAFTTPLEERANQLLTLLEEKLRAALTEAKLQIPNAEGPPYGEAASSPKVFLARYNMMRDYGGWREVEAWADALHQRCDYPARLLQPMLQAAKAREASTVL